MANDINALGINPIARLNFVDKIGKISRVVKFKAAKVATGAGRVLKQGVVVGGGRCAVRCHHDEPIKIG